MTNPFELLGVSKTADDKEIKSAYLDKVREFPPERSPEMFQVIRDAFEQIKTEKARLAYALFHNLSTDSTVLCQNLLRRGKPARPSEKIFKQTLAETMASKAGLTGTAEH